MTKFIQAKHSESIFWETISPYTLFEFLTSVGEFHMDTQKALEFIKEISERLDLEIDAEHLRLLPKE